MNISFPNKAEKIASIINLVNKIMVVYKNLPRNTELKKGGYLTILELVTGVPLLITPIGELPQEKIVKYLTLSQEKATRLYIQKSIGHLSSWESRDPTKDKWGGAIYTWGYIYSFSGLPELADEALVLVAAVLEKDLPEKMAQKIAAKSNNPIFKELLNAMVIN